LKHARYVPPSGFGYPLDGLLPRTPGRVCFTPAALLGFTLRRFPPAGSFRSLSAEMNPPTVSPAVFPPPKRQTGPTGLGFWVLASRRCLAAARRIRPTATGAFLGFCPSRVSQRRPWPRLLRASSPALCSPQQSPARNHRRPRVSQIIASPRPTLHRSAHRPRQPSWGSCTCPDQEHSRQPPPGLFASPCTGPCITADSTDALWATGRLYRSCLDRRSVPIGDIRGIMHGYCNFRFIKNI
jgi:hypothetical protein